MVYKPGFAWRTPDMLTERTLRIPRLGRTYQVSQRVYDFGRRQQFSLAVDGTEIGRDCAHDLGVFGHMQRMLKP